MLPGPVLVMLRVLSWLLAPHLALAVGGLFMFSNRGVFVCCTLTVISVICALMLHMHDRVDDRIAAGLAAQAQAQDALVHVVDVVAGDPPPPPAESPTRRLSAVPAPRA